MGAYAHLLAQAHPGAVVETALLWTATGALMPLPPDVTAAALDRAALEAGVVGPTLSAPGLSVPPGADASAHETDIPAPALP
jgi:hypothetical protein